MSGFAFISYAREDREYVDKLAKHLGDEGIDVWFDAHLETGSRADQVILDKIKQCTAFIVIMSTTSSESQFVLDEFDLAREERKEMMPVLLSGRPFFGLGRIQYELLTAGELPSARYVETLRQLVAEGELRFEMKAHEGKVLSVAYPMSHSSMVASAGEDKCVRIWDPTTGTLRHEIRGATWPVAFTRDGDLLATGGEDFSVHLWDTETGKLVRRVGSHNKSLISIAISWDGTTLVTGSKDTREHVWDLNSGERRHTLTGRVEPGSPLVLSPDGSWLIAPTNASTTRSAGLWNVNTGKLIGTLAGHRGPVHDVTVSWDGRYVATGGEDNTARIWDAKTGDELRILGAHTKAVRAVAFSPSGYRLATGSTDQTIRLWDATTGAHIKRVTQRASGIYDLAYSPDGRTLASGHGDGAIRIWKA